MLNLFKLQKYINNKIQKLLINETKTFYLRITHVECIRIDFKR